jgi:biotin carboxyl carrier protein
VVAVLVGAGDEVGDGADLLVMEAMKMEHRIKAPGPSHVVEVLVAPGDQVDAGRLLIRLEERAP